jgi:hypothetical protein
MVVSFATFCVDFSAIICFSVGEKNSFLTLQLIGEGVAAADLCTGRFNEDIDNMRTRQTDWAMWSDYALLRCVLRVWFA